jgi:hypothetical protein
MRRRVRRGSDRECGRASSVGLPAHGLPRASRATGPGRGHSTAAGVTIAVNSGAGRRCDRAFDQPLVRAKSILRTSSPDLADVRHLIAEGPSTRHRRPGHDTLAHDHRFGNATLVPSPGEQEDDVRPSAEVRLLAGQAPRRGERWAGEPGAAWPGEPGQAAGGDGYRWCCHMISTTAANCARATAAVRLTGTCTRHSRRFRAGLLRFSSSRTPSSAVRCRIHASIRAARSYGVT